MEDRDDKSERKSITSLWLDGLKGLKEEDFAPIASPKNWIQFAAFSVVFKLKSTVTQKNVNEVIRTIVNHIHKYLMSTGISGIKILAGMTPEVKLVKTQILTVFYGYAIDNPGNNPVLPVKIFPPILENTTQGCKQMGIASWKYAGLLENSDLVRKALESQIKQPFSIVLGLNPAKSEYKWIDRDYKVVDSDVVYTEFPKDVITPV
ncbi:MAG: hypothetical protein ACXAEF_16390 [Candidatus Thorarchaeota archaeon]|jgi:hypothetical protein